MVANVPSGLSLSPLTPPLSRVHSMGQVLKTPKLAVPAPKDKRIFLCPSYCLFPYPLSHAGRATNTRPFGEISPPCL